MSAMANDISAFGQPVAAGFSTHPHWDHVVWHAEFGETPRYGTARCAAYIGALLASANWKDEVNETLPPEVDGQMSLDGFGLIAGLPAESAEVPWRGPAVRIIEHQGHAPGHAALLIEEARVLVVGDMLSDILIPMLDFEAGDPIEDYLAGLQLLESEADNVDVFVPGHGSVGGPDELRARVALDRAYVSALRDGSVPSDPRIGPLAKPGWEWVNDVHAGQLEQLTLRGIEGVDPPRAAVARPRQ
jgi:glyoxylase-like metal-dependent hydrolase (beta-lactamase superfamily II)